jgi:hypothetical protein
MYRSIRDSPAVDPGLAHHLGNLRAARHHRVNDRRKFFETHIRHHSSLCRPPGDVGALVGAVILASLGARLVTGVGRTARLGGARPTARAPAVLLSPEVAPTYKEPPLAEAAAQVVQGHFIGRVHPRGADGKKLDGPGRSGQIPRTIRAAPRARGVTPGPSNLSPTARPLVYAHSAHAASFLLPDRSLRAGGPLSEQPPGYTAQPQCRPAGHLDGPPLHLGRDLLTGTLLPSPTIDAPGLRQHRGIDWSGARTEGPDPGPGDPGGIGTQPDRW